MKTDVIGALIIGFIIAVLFVSISYSTQTVIRPDNGPPFYYWFSLVIFPLGLTAGMFVISNLGNKIVNRFFIVYQLYKFALVAGLNTLLYTIIYNGLTVATQTTEGIKFIFFNGAGFAASVINSYFWNKYWTFQRENRITVREFAQFLLISMAGLGISIGIVNISMNIIGPAGDISPYIWANISQVFSIIVANAWNFIGYKYIALRER